MNTTNIIINGAAGKPIVLDISSANPGKRQPVILYAHGFNGFKDWGASCLITEAFTEAGFVMIRFNFSHNGTTPERQGEFVDLEAFGNNNYSKQLADIKSVTDWICDSDNPYREAIDAGNIYLVGHSMGGGISILFAAEDSRIKKLITWAAISECKTPWGSWPLEKMKQWLLEGVQYYTNTRTRQQLPLYYQLYLDYKSNEQRLSIENACKKLTIPFLICHGTNDISVPVESAYELQAWQPAATLFTVEGNHVFDQVHPWQKRYLPEAMETVVQRSISFLQ